MAHFRVVPTSLWTDDLFLSASPEQKLIAIYIYTSPFATQCGVYKLPIRTMGFHLGLTQFPAESALKGLCASLPDLFAYDDATKEVAILQHPRNVLLNASNKIMRQVIEELKNVDSTHLLKEIIKRNSATMSAPYLSRLRAINASRINGKDVNNVFDVDMPILIDNEQVRGEIETEIETEIEMNINAVENVDADKIINASKYAKDAFLSFLDSNPQYKMDVPPAEFAAAVDGHFNKLQKEGQTYELQVPTDIGKMYGWVGKRLAGVRSWMSAARSFDKKSIHTPPQEKAAYRAPAVEQGNKTRLGVVEMPKFGK